MIYNKFRKKIIEAAKSGVFGISCSIFRNYFFILKIKKMPGAASF